MPILNISLSGETNASVSGTVTDPNVLLQIKAIMRHMSDRAQQDPTPPEETPGA